MSIALIVLTAARCALPVLLLLFFLVRWHRIKGLKSLRALPYTGVALKVLEDAPDHEHINAPREMPVAGLEHHPCKRRGVSNKAKYACLPIG